MADVLHHSPNLEEWFSLYPEDKIFGAKHDFFKQDLTGRNTYVNPPFNTFENKQNLIEKVIEKVSDSLRSNRPTRDLSPFLMEKLAISMRIKQGNRAFWK